MPPHTAIHEEMRLYAADRSYISGEFANRWLFGDIALQPFTLVATLLMLFALGVSWHDPLLPALGVGFGVLLTFGSGWAWWRSSNTFMTYLGLAGRRHQPDHASASS